MLISGRALPSCVAWRGLLQGSSQTPCWQGKAKWNDHIQGKGGSPSMREGYDLEMTPVLPSIQTRQFHPCCVFFGK